jgi:hypothetical protein
VIDSPAVRWYRLICEAEAVRTCWGLGLASVWGHINANDYPSARAEMDRVYHDWAIKPVRFIDPPKGDRRTNHDQHL